MQLKVRSKQMAILSDHAIEQFKNSVIVQLEQVLPEEVSMMDEFALREKIQYGIKKSKTHGITEELGVCKYIIAMFIFGRDFEVDPDYKTLADILDAANGRHAIFRADEVYQQALQTLS